MSAYLVARFEVKDPDALGDYSQHAAPIIKAHGGALLFKGGSEGNLTGSDPLPKIAVFEFPDRAALDAFYASAEYQALTTQREKGAEMVLSAHG